MKKRIMTALLAGSMLLSLAACGSSASTPSNNAPAAASTEAADSTAQEQEAPSVYPEKKVLIGVELYNPTESETIKMQEYFNYIAEGMNVEFKYSEAIKDADDEVKFIEDCAISGCDAFIARYNVTGIEQASMVMEYGMFFWGLAEEPEIYEQLKGEELYLGNIHFGNDDYVRGTKLADWVKENDLHKVIYASGGADFGVAMFVNRQQGFLDGLEGYDCEVITVSGFPGDQFYADQSAALSTDGVEAVVASFNGVNFWAQPIETAGLKETVKLATIGDVNEECKDAFDSGALSFLASANSQRYGLGIGVICNAVDGNAAALMKDGEAINEQVSSWAISSADECTAYLNILDGDRVFSVDDIKSLCVKVNPEASHDTLMALIDASTSEALMSR